MDADVPFHRDCLHDNLLGRWIYLGMVALLMAGCVVHQAISTEKMSVEVLVVDETGAPVPFVTLGYVVEPATEFRHLTREDLEREMKVRHHLWEYWSDADSPFLHLRGGVLTDLEGRARFAFRNPMSEQISIGASRSGYAYAIGTVTLQPGAKRANLKLELPRSASGLASLTPYRRTLYEVRLEITDFDRNDDMTRKNHDRLETLRTKLEKAAEDALAVGDKPAAAEILYWVMHMPEVTMEDGRAVGFNQYNAYSERNVRTIQRAAALDPDNFAVVTTLLSMERRPLSLVSGVYKSDEELNVALAAWLKRALAIERRAKEKGVTLWPDLAIGIALTYGALGHYDKKLERLLELQRMEPKAGDFSGDIKVNEKFVREGKGWVPRYPLDE